MSSSALPSIVPQPARIEILPDTFVLEPATKIRCDRDLMKEGQLLAETLRRATGFAIPVTSEGSPATACDITLEIQPDLRELGPEGYKLVSRAEQPVSIQAPFAHGVFNGIQTLLQLLPPAIFSRGPRIYIDWTMPRVEIEDRPQFRWRGAMLDCSRHFMPMEFIKKFIDLLAMHKLNTFHWHLTDDQGWRLEIKKYPKLTEVGSRRRETIRGHVNAAASGDGIPVAGYYSHDDAREIVAYAAERHINIVPEIDMPGHSQAAIAAYPELGCTDEPLSVWTQWGINPNIYNVRESTIRFLQDVLLEVMEIFPSPYIHVGGDEAVKAQWEASPETRARMAEVGAKDAAEMQSWFIRRMDDFLTLHGRRLVGWDEILEGGLAPGATVMSWRGVEGGIAAAKAGHDVVMAPGTHTYFDSYQSPAMTGEPLAIGGCVTLEKAYGFVAIPPELTPEQSAHILGVQGQLWTEYIPTPGHAEYMGFPRLCALAEVGWESRKGDYQEFVERLRRHLKRLDVIGVRYRPLE